MLFFWSSIQIILKEYALQFPQNIKQLLFHIDNNTLF